MQSRMGPGNLPIMRSVSGQFGQKPGKIYMYSFNLVKLAVLVKIHFSLMFYKNVFRSYIPKSVSVFKEKYVF